MISSWLGLIDFSAIARDTHRVTFLREWVITTEEMFRCDIDGSHPSFAFKLYLFTTNDHSAGLQASHVPTQTA